MHVSLLLLLLPALFPALATALDPTCLSCPIHESPFMDVDGEVVCMCDETFAKVLTSDSTFDCACPPGTHLSHGRCVECPPGSYKPLLDLGSCSECADAAKTERNDGFVAGADKTNPPGKREARSASETLAIIIIRLLTLTTTPPFHVFSHLRPQLHVREARVPHRFLHSRWPFRGSVHPLPHRFLLLHPRLHLRNPPSPLRLLAILPPLCHRHAVREPQVVPAGLYVRRGPHGAAVQRLPAQLREGASRGELVKLLCTAHRRTNRSRATREQTKRDTRTHKERAQDAKTRVTRTNAALHAKKRRSPRQRA